MSVIVNFLKTILSGPYLLVRLFKCPHKWETIQKIDVYAVDAWGEQLGQHPRWHDYILKCEVCGNVKRKRL